jgi:hypothetical protein
MKPSIEVLSEQKSLLDRYITLIIALTLHWTNLSFFTSAVITGVQMGEICRLGCLGCLIGWSSRDMWTEFLY